MKSHALKLGVAAAATLALAACNNNGAANKTETAQTPAAKKAAGDKTIAAGLTADGKFMAAAKTAGLDQTLAGQLTGVITNLILQGTVMAADIGKAIDAGKGKTVLATVGGGTLTATKDGDKIVLTDAAGHKATVTQADDQFTNGVVHHIDAVLTPPKGQAAKPAVGQKAG